MALLANEQKRKIFRQQFAPLDESTKVYVQLVTNIGNENLATTSWPTTMAQLAFRCSTRITYHFLTSKTKIYLSELVSQKQLPKLEFNVYVSIETNMRRWTATLQWETMWEEETLRNNI